MRFLFRPKLGALIDSLLESLDVEIDNDAEEAWREDLPSGPRNRQWSSKLIPWHDAERSLWARLQR